MMMTTMTRTFRKVAIRRGVSQRSFLAAATAPDRRCIQGRTGGIEMMTVIVVVMYRMPRYMFYMHLRRRQATKSLAKFERFRAL